MIFYARLLCFLVFVSCYCITNAQTQAPTLGTFQNNITTLADNFPQEKIYLHFDKPSYVPGETIWFKAYIMAGLDPSLISKTVYIDFLNASGRVLKHCIAPVFQSSANNDFSIPLDFKDEFIYVKAYTRWMLNFDSSFLFHKTIHVTQTKDALKKPAPAAVKSSIQFLPEGGYLINNLEGIIAFKATHYDGRPALVQGAVFNNKNQQVATIKTIHDGMGSFALTAKDGETYTAKWKDDAGSSYETKLPAAQPYGATVKVQWRENARSFLIQRSDNAPDNFKKLYIVATMQQHLIYAASVNLSETTATGGSIPAGSLPSGILQVTLFDSNWNAVAERISFINNDAYSFEPEVGFAQLGIEKRKPNVLVIQTPDSISANLSVAITDAGVGVDSSDDIISRLLLTGDLKGGVYHPHYYFQNNSDTLQQQLDLVMLTNGWRRINWNDVIRNKYPQIKYPNDTSYLSLTGKVFGASEPDLKKGAFVFMIITNSKDTAKQAQQAIVDGSGNFSNPNLILYDTSKIYYRISGTESFSNSSVVNFNGSMAATKISPEDTVNNSFFLDTVAENYRRRLAEEELRLFKLQQGSTLETVTVTTRAKSPMQVLDEKYASALFSGGDGYQFDVMNDISANAATSLLQYLQGKIPGLSISMSGSPGSPGSASYRGGGAPSIFLNESPVDMSMVSSLNMSDVAYIKFMRPPFIGAMGGGANGAIAIYTRKGGDAVKSADSKGIPYKLVIGYTAPKEFYSPNYDTYNEKNEDQDLRSTLYWAPMVLTSPGNNTIRLKFYNNDFSQSFRVVVEGMTTDGKLTRVEKVIE